MGKRFNVQITSNFITSSDLTGCVINQENPVIYNPMLSDDRNKQSLWEFTKKRFDMDLTNDELNRFMEFGKESLNRYAREYQELVYGI